MRWRRHDRLAGALCASLVLAGCGSDSDSSQTTGNIVGEERVWIDSSRATPRTSRFPGAPDRTLRVRLWTPRTDEALPLLVLAHGYGGLPEKFEALARSIARAGFVVAAPAFPLTNQNAPGGHEPGLSDTVRQPGDLSFVISQLLSADAGDMQIGQRILPSAVAVLGHSLGGVTALALTRLQCCRDQRVRAVILFAAWPGLLDLLFPEPTLGEGPPTLLIHGTADAAVPYSDAGELFARLQPPRLLIGLSAVGHSEALESQEDPAIAARDATERATVAFLNAVFRDGSSELDTTLAALAAAGHTVRMETQ